MNTQIALIILFIHFVSDFIFQDEKWATTKSVSIISLLKHTLTYSLIWLTIGSLYSVYLSIYKDIQVGELVFKMTLYFTLITFVAHTITDYFTSKVTKRLYEQKKFGSSIPNLGFFTVIGGDQILHYIQLFLTFELVTRI